MPTLRKFPLRKIIDEVCRFYMAPVDRVIAGDRSAHIYPVRHVAYYLCREFTGLKPHAIGAELGIKDISVIYKSCKRVEEQKRSDDDYAEELERCKSSVEKLINQQ